MNITVTFTGSGRPELPDGSVLVFEDVRDLHVEAPAEVEDVSSESAGCRPDCTAVHRRFTGASHLRLEASGDRDRGPRWVIPGAAF